MKPSYPRILVLVFLQFCCTPFVLSIYDTNGLLIYPLVHFVSHLILPVIMCWMIALWLYNKEGIVYLSSWCVLSCLLAELQAYLTSVKIFSTDLEDKCAYDSPPATIPPAIQYLLTGLILLYIMQNWELSHCWNLLVRLILMLTFLLHVSVKKVNLNTNKLLLNLTAWASSTLPLKLAALATILRRP